MFQLVQQLKDFPLTQHRLVHLLIPMNTSWKTHFTEMKKKKKKLAEGQNEILFAEKQMKLRQGTLPFMIWNDKISKWDLFYLHFEIEVKQLVCINMMLWKERSVITRKQYWTFLYFCGQFTFFISC